MNRTLLLLAIASTGCGASLRDHLIEDAQGLPPALPPARIDVAASEVILEVPGVNGAPQNAQSGEAIREEVAYGLASIMHSDVGPPARFRLRGRHEVEAWPLVACLGVLPMVGCPVSVQTADVVLEVQVGEETWVGHGDAEVYTGFYYNVNGQGAALAAAITEALTEIAESRRRQYTENLGASR